MCLVLDGADFTCNVLLTKAGISDWVLYQCMMCIFLYIKYPVVNATNLSFASHMIVGLNVLCTCSDSQTVSGYASIFSFLAVDQFVLN